MEKHPELKRLVAEHLIHRCVNRCLDERRICKRIYPKLTSNVTIIVKNGYTKYKRRSIGAFTEHGTITNAQLVPLNPYLLFKYLSHINVE